MNKIKKRTLIDKCRDAYRAFRGKQLGSLTFGIDVKKCHECEYTTDIRHAKNFEYVAGYVREIDETHE